MLYLVEAHPSIERGNIVDAGDGPGPVVAKIVERFRPQAIYGNPSRRQVVMVVDLDTPAKMAELMYVLAWFVDVEPTFTPLMPPEIYGEAIANAKKIISRRINRLARLALRKFTSGSGRACWRSGRRRLVSPSCRSCRNSRVLETTSQRRTRWVSVAD